MFRNEKLFHMIKLSDDQIKEKRRKLTGPILERIHHKVVMMMQDAKIKLLLKNCMNNFFSLIESCKLNDIDPQDYLKHLFECILYGKDCDKKALLPIFLIIHIVVGLWIPIVVIPFYRSSKITFLKEILKWYY